MEIAISRPVTSFLSGAIYYQHTYYVATTTMDNNSSNKFPILLSKDLVTWTGGGFVFTNTSLPKWAIGDFWYFYFFFFLFFC